MNKTSLPISFLFALILCIYSCNNTVKPKDKQPFTIDTSEAKEADSLYHIKAYLPALARYKEIISTTGGDSLDYFRSANCETELYLFPEAIEDYKSALDHNYKKSSCYINLTAIYSLLRDSSMTEYYGNKCIEIDSSKKEMVKGYILSSKREIIKKDSSMLF